MVFFAPLWKSESMAVWWRGQTARGEDWWRSVKQQWTPRPSHPPLPTVWGKRTNEKANRQTVWKRKSIWSNSSDIIYAYFYSSDFRLPPSLHVFNVLYYMGEASLSLSTKCTTAQSQKSKGKKLEEKLEKKHILMRSWKMASNYRRIKTGFCCQIVTTSEEKWSKFHRIASFPNFGVLVLMVGIRIWSIPCSWWWAQWG